MAAPFIVPFNFQPSSTTLRTSSYTIPAGFYGEIFDDAGNMSINGVDVGSFLITGTGTASAGASGTFNHPAQALLRFNWSISGSGIDSFNLFWYGTFGRTDGVTNSGTFTYFPGFFTSSTVSAVSTNDTCTYTVYNWVKSSSKIWVKTGEIINGNRYWVTLFPMIQ